MDEFGVLTERFGLKPQGKSAPMAAAKRSNDNNSSQSWNLGMDSDSNPKPSSSSSNFGSFLDDQSGGFQFSGSKKTNSYGRSDDYDDIFGGPINSAKQSGNAGGSSFDYDSIFSSSNVKSSSFNSYNNDDIFGGIPGLNSSSSANYDSKSDDILGSFASAPKQRPPVDDLLGDLVGAKAKPNSTKGSSSSNVVKNASGFDDLIPGFGGGSSNNRRITENTRPHQSTKATFASSDDPFAVFESTTSTSNNAYDSSDLLSDPLERISKFNNSGGAKPPRLKSPPKATPVSKGYKVKSSGVSSIDELENFAKGKVQTNANGRSNFHSSEEWFETPTNRTTSYSEDDLESFFRMGSRSNSAPRARANTSDPVFNALVPQTNNRGGPRPKAPQRTTSGTPPNIKKSSSASGIFDDLSSMFGDAEMFGEFQEVDGESEERRKARLGRHQRTQQRVEQAVADMNQRDFQSQQEQDERRRIAETLDIDIKRWSAGKEGNMRALLSSLQYVLWPECGWEPVSLTDIITSNSVKKVYRKATLCVHPDKVQQKGATLQQKYIAEKVFDVLKEAWNKFNKEELR
ncbi:hypothetical protein UlMin_035882 [Ulmus minor]